MRTASLVGAAEFVSARLAASADGGVTNRAVIDSVLQRADEPGELLAYWTGANGRRVPKPVKRGVADAVKRLYDERAVLKWDSDARGFRMADVLNLAHPSPAAGWQGSLFQYVMDRRRDGDAAVPADLRTIAARRELMAWPVSERRALFSRPDTADVLRFYRELVSEAPDELGTVVRLGTVPPLPVIPADLHWRPAIAVACCYAGTVEDGVFETDFANVDLLAGWILRQNGRAVPLEPDELVEAVSDALEALEASHDGDAPVVAGR